MYNPLWLSLPNADPTIGLRDMAELGLHLVLDPLVSIQSTEIYGAWARVAPHPELIVVTDGPQQGFIVCGWRFLWAYVIT